MIHLRLFVAFAKVGLLGFGGGPSMIPLLQAECVGAGWLSNDQFVEALAAANALPGPIATKMAVHVGGGQAGVSGAISALAGIVAPSALMMALLGAVLIRYKDNRWVAGALAGAKPAIVGLLAFVAWDLAPTAVRGPVTGAIAAAAFGLLVLQVHPGFVIAGSVVVGLLALRG